MNFKEKLSEIIYVLCNSSKYYIFMSFTIRKFEKIYLVSFTVFFFFFFNLVTDMVVNCYHMSQQW